MRTFMDFRRTMTFFNFSSPHDLTNKVALKVYYSMKIHQGTYTSPNFICPAIFYLQIIAKRFHYRVKILNKIKGKKMVGKCIVIMIQKNYTVPNFFFSNIILKKHCREALPREINFCSNSSPWKGVGFRPWVDSVSPVISRRKRDVCQMSVFPVHCIYLSGLKTFSHFASSS